MRRAALLALGALGAPAGTVSAGSYFPPPGDCCPQWSPHGTQIVFETTRGAPDSKQLAFLGQDGGLHTVNVDGTIAERIARGPATNPVWSPDGRDIAYVDPNRADPNSGVRYVAGSNGSDNPEGGPGTTGSAVVT